MSVTCTLHIGIEKTGTTAVQRFLERNREALKSRGFIVPRTLGQQNHTRLATYAMEDDKVDDTRRWAGLETPEDVRLHRLVTEEALGAELRESSCTTALLSNEHCHSRLTSPSEVTRLADLLGRHFDEIRVLVYLRTQVEVAVSLYSTALRAGWTHERVLPEISEPPYYYDYAAILDQWAAVFGREAVAVRLFDVQELIGGDICLDYAQAVSLDARGLKMVPRVNESLRPTAQTFLREMNKRVPVWLEGRPNPDRGNLVELVERGREGQGVQPAREDVDRFMRVFDDVNERVRAAWFPERRFLFRERNDWPESASEGSPLRLEDAFDIFADLWTEKTREARKLQRRSGQRAQD